MSIFMSKHLSKYLNAHRLVFFIYSYLLILKNTESMQPCARPSRQTVHGSAQIGVRCPSGALRALLPSIVGVLNEPGQGDTLLYKNSQNKAF